jgi:tRNA pseudouridine65 synthase
VILFRDAHLVVVAKPSGVAVHRGMAAERDTMLARVRDAVGAYVHPVHRLDRGTSGALIFALDADTAREMHVLFAREAVEKRYLALVRGCAPEQTRIDHPIPKSEDGERVPAVTDLRRLWASDAERCSLVEARPHTGRFHQIRRHAKHLSHPVIGDVTYGDGRVNRHFREIAALHRLALHAAELSFPHPHTGERVRVRAPIPEDLAAPLVQLGAGIAAGIGG